jgi:hypothetical protein
LNGANGGAGGTSTLGGVGGNAVTGTANAGQLTLTQSAIGGRGGTVAAGAAGAGGAGSSSFTLNDGSNASQTVFITATGGIGGASSGNAAGTGGNATATGSVTGTVGVGDTVAATGGGGGAGFSAGGTGGTASATAGATGTATATSLLSAAIALGGAGGSGSQSTASGGAGGSATANATATGAAAATGATITSQAAATGGAGGTSLTNLATGGAATATSTATGAGSLSSTATAAGGGGLGGAGIATATAIATGNAAGATSMVEAHATTTQPGGAHVASITTDSLMNVNSGALLNTGTSKTFANAQMAFVAPNPTGMQGTAWLVGQPVASDISSVPAGMKTAIGSNTILGLGDVSGGYSTAGSGTETVTDTLDLHAILNSTDLTQDLIVGFYGGSDVLGTGSTDVGAVVLTVTEDGKSVFTQNFASGSAAHTFFANNSTANLGLLGAGGSGFSAGTVHDFGVSLNVTTTAVGSTFDGRVLITT